MKTITRIVALAVTASLLVTCVAPAGAASSEQPSEAIDVDLETDGSGTVTVRSTYDLETDVERQAFEELQSDDQAREDLQRSFRERMAAVAQSAENVTDREMAITDASVNLTVVEDIGLVELTATWEGLAAVENDRLVVTEPFASGFGLDRPVVLQFPDDYTVSNASPAPDDREGALRWDAGTDLEGFVVSLEPSTDDPIGDDTTAEPTTTSGPGFGALVAILGLSSLVAIGHRD